MKRSRFNPDTDDMVLVKMVSSENESAFEVLFSRYAHTVQAFISLRISGDEDPRRLDPMARGRRMSL